MGFETCFSMYFCFFFKIFQYTEILINTSKVIHMCCCGMWNDEEKRRRNERRKKKKKNRKILNAIAMWRWKRMSQCAHGPITVNHLVLYLCCGLSSSIWFWFDGKRHTESQYEVPNEKRRMAKWEKPTKWKRNTHTHTKRKGKTLFRRNRNELVVAWN